jgi:hypothetical protein
MLNLAVRSNSMGHEPSREIDRLPVVDGDEYMGVSPVDLEAQLEAFVPYITGDDRRSKYLSYRACGFSIKEACKLVDVELRTLYRWREDPDFRRYEAEELQDIRKSLGAEFTLMEFLRNTRLVLAKDFDIIMRAFGRLKIDGDDTDKMDILSEREWQYFKDAVKRYGPDQLMKLQAAITGKMIPEPAPPAKFVIPWTTKVTQNVQNNTINVIQTATDGIQQVPQVEEADSGN